MISGFFADVLHDVDFAAFRANLHSICLMMISLNNSILHQEKLYITQNDRKLIFDIVFSNPNLGEPMQRTKRFVMSKSTNFCC